MEPLAWERLRVFPDPAVLGKASVLGGQDQLQFPKSCWVFPLRQQCGRHWGQAGMTWEDPEGRGEGPGQAGGVGWVPVIPS